MEFTFQIGMWAIVAMIVGAVVVGVVIQLFGEPGFGYEWLATGLGGILGGFAASEFIVGFRTWEPVIDGLALIPAALGGIVVAVLVAVVARLLATASVDSRSTA